MLRLVSADADDVISLERLHAHLHVDANDQDALIRAYLAGAVAKIEGETTRILKPSVFEWRLDDWPVCRTLALPVAPIRDVLTVTYVDAAGDEIALDNDMWDWEPSDTGARLWFSALMSYPDLGRPFGAVRIGFEAGYDIDEGTALSESEGDSESDDDLTLALPPHAVPCLLLIVGHWFANRETASDQGLKEIPLGAERLMQLLRIYR